MKILFIFVDGFGVGSDDPEVNPLAVGRFSLLERLVAERAASLDACLGVDGLPQSATGQATMLTGVNAAELMDRHIEGFPPARLKTMIQQENLFSKLMALGKTCTFANSYWLDDVAHIPSKRESVTTVMTLSALGEVRGKDDLLAGRAVNHDISRWTMHLRGYDGPLISPEEAGQHLVEVAGEHDFTLFEYFMTDRVGHSRDAQQRELVLDNLERMLSVAIGFAQQPNQLVLLTSDHGNIEDASIKSHTFNPVPFVALGDGAVDIFGEMKSLVDVTPALVRAFGR